MTKSIKDTTIKDFFYMFLIVVVPFICVAGISVFPYRLRLPLMYATGILFLITFIFSNIKIEFNLLTTIAFLLIVYMGITVLHSYDPTNSFTLFTWYACSFVLLFIDMPINYFDKILTIMYVICIIMAISIIISVPINNCMLNYFWFIVNPNHSADVTHSITRELSIGAYSGFAREKAEAAYVLNIGIAISFSKFFSVGKYEKKDFIFLLMFLTALLLTGKRTLFIVVVLCFCIFMVISKVKGKFFKFALITLVAVSACIIIFLFVPSLSTIFYRFMDNENLETMSNRDTLWYYSELMFKKSPIFGVGFGSYNNFAADNGLLVGGHQWDFNGHNSYLQVLGELGIVGLSMYVLIIFLALSKTLILLRRNYNNRQKSYLLYFSLYCQLLLIIYAITGNIFYTKQMMFCWFFAIGITLFISRNSYKSSKRLNNKILIKRGI